MKLSIEVLKSLIPNSSLDYRKKNIIGDCAYCGGHEFGISVENNHVFGCFRKSKCGETGNIYKLLKKLNRLDLLKEGDNITITSQSYLEDVISFKEQILEDLPEIQIPLGYKRVSSHPYLKERGFEEDDYNNYEVGVTRLNDKLQDCIVFLIRQKERLVGYVARYTKSKEEIKEIEQKTGRRILRYRNSSTDFESLLYGINECTKNTDTVILVEGLFGKQNVDKQLQLRSQEYIKCLCTFGAKISLSQILLLHQAEIKNIILMFDPDVIDKIKQYGMRLVDEFDSVRIALIPYEDKDPADLIKSEILEVLGSLRDPFNFSLNIVKILDLK